MQTMTATTARVKTIHHHMTCGTAAAAAIQNTKMGENENESKHKNIHAQTKGIHTERIAEQLERLCVASRQLLHQ